MTIKEVLEKTTTFFKSKNFPSPRLDAELLISGSLGLERIQLYLKFDQPLKAEEVDKCREVVRRRTQGEPVAYILNQKFFYGIDFYVDQRVLIPRPETELLVEMALEEIKTHGMTNPKILDLGCGSGCIGLTILNRVPEAQVSLVDREPGPIEVTRRNAEKLGVLDRAQILQHNAAELKLDQSFDLVLANPPYIDHHDTLVDKDVKKFEPESALFASEEGLAAIKAWVPVALEHCRSGGRLIFEIGWQQGPSVAEIFKTGGLSEVKVHQDLSGKDRFVSGRK